MRIPISKRLLACASLLTPVDTVADVGTDHGYLPIWLLKNGLCRRAIAADLREKPLAIARQNAERFGTAADTEFVCCDGLTEIAAGSFDALVIAGMGGDAIAAILEAAPWIADARYTLVLQPQSSGNDLRRYLGLHNWRTEREMLVKDGRFLYAAMRVRCGGGRPLSPGEQFLSPALKAEQSPYEAEYRERLIRSLAATVEGIARGETEDDRRKLDYYRTAWEELSCDWINT